MYSKAEKPATAGASSRLSLSKKAACAFFAGIALFSVVRMIFAVLDGSRFQYSDYWRMIQTLLQADGSLNVSGLFTFSNVHLIAVAQLLYWLNIKLFAGSNITLGLVDVVIVCCTLGLLGLMIRRLECDQTMRFAFFGLAGALLFSLSGAWNFVYAMSGAAWLSANLFVVAAIYLRSIDRNRTAFAAAVLATMSYGTGLFAWPAIIAAGVIRRDFSRWWREWPYALGFLLSIVVIKILNPVSGDTSSNNLLIILRLAATFLGGSIGLAGIWAELVGWLVLFAVPLLIIGVTFRVRSPANAAWVGLALYGWSAILVITQGRALFMAIYGYQGRYYSLAALTWLALSVLAIKLVNSIRRSGGLRGDGLELFQKAFPWILILLLMFGALFSGKVELEKRESRSVSQALGEIALRLDVVDGSVGYLEGFTDNTVPFDSTRALAAAGHYPFVDDWDLDCGLLGQTLGATAGRRGAGELRKVAPEPGLDAVNRINGIIHDKSNVTGAIRCIVVVDPAGVVVGAGTSRLPREGDNRLMFAALAHQIKGDYKLFVFDEGDEPIVLSGPSAKARPAK